MAACAPGYGKQQLLALEDALHAQESNGKHLQLMLQYKGSAIQIQMQDLQVQQQQNLRQELVEFQQQVHTLGDEDEGPKVLSGVAVGPEVLSSEGGHCWPMLEQDWFEGFGG